ncbi:MAG: inorganic pyrophosphatase Ppa [Thermodesulfobacteriota bacterium]
MPLRYFPEAVKEFALQVYQKPKNIEDLSLTHVAFTGTPQKHLHDPDKVVLVIDPYSSNLSYYEFNNCDISFVEKLSNTVDPEGNVLPIMRLWVKKNSIGTHCNPFVVADTIRRGP